MVNVLEQITYYRELKGWSEYQLAEKSGLTQSTISSWYRKNMLPSITSLEKICNAFEITLSQFFDTENDSLVLTSIQKQLIQESNRMSDKQKLALLNLLKTF